MATVDKRVASIELF